MTLFKVGQELKSRSICDSESFFTATVIKRTAKTVTILTGVNSEKRCKIHESDGREFIYPEGRYSMCPIFRA